MWNVLRILPWQEKELTASQELRQAIRARRYREILPVGVLSHLGWLTEQTLILWVVFYYLFDMICMVLWCPLQLAFMHNRCCTNYRDRFCYLRGKLLPLSATELLEHRFHKHKLSR